MNSILPPPARQITDEAGTASGALEAHALLCHGEACARSRGQRRWTKLKPLWGDNVAKVSVFSFGRAPNVTETAHFLNQNRARVRGPAFSTGSGPAPSYSVCGAPVALARPQFSPFVRAPAALARSSSRRAARFRALGVRARSPVPSTSFVGLRCTSVTRGLRPSYRAAMARLVVGGGEGVRSWCLFGVLSKSFLGRRRSGGSPPGGEE